jgi:methionine synthase II (cobalamin-independent)
MSKRAWPFEDESEESSERIHTPEQFVARRDETEAIVNRIGLNDAQLVLVDGEGRWQRWVYHSVEEAKEVAESLGVEVHVGEYPEQTRVRMNSYRRPPEDFDRAPYPEQGRVGPVIPYPENRPRKVTKASRAGETGS